MPEVVGAVQNVRLGNWFEGKFSEGLWLGSWTRRCVYSWHFVAIAMEIEEWVDRVKISQEKKSAKNDTLLNATKC